MLTYTLILYLYLPHTYYNTLHVQSYLQIVFHLFPCGNCYNIDNSAFFMWDDIQQSFDSSYERRRTLHAANKICDNDLSIHYTQHTHTHTILYTPLCIHPPSLYRRIYHSYPNYMDHAIKTTIPTLRSILPLYLFH